VAAFRLLTEKMASEPFQLPFELGNFFLLACVSRYQSTFLFNDIGGGLRAFDMTELYHESIGCVDFQTYL
ncbi:hypothetical protein, partial [Ferrovum myxofaciens]|uniref:hypothetical protein n=1 Tax=Ferrovum myxofaciens TaxID=416213 RepID=UPI00235308C8